jgi:putative queuosine salvage protein
VNLLADKFPSFRDETKFERKKVRFLKRAQILVADLWAAFGGESFGKFNDIDKITMFAGMFTY